MRKREERKKSWTALGDRDGIITVRVGGQFGLRMGDRVNRVEFRAEIAKVARLKKLRWK